MWAGLHDVGAFLQIYRLLLACFYNISASHIIDSIFLQLLNGLERGGAYGLIALGLTLVFGTLGVVNFAHGAIFIIGAFCAVSVEKQLTLSTRIMDASITFFDAYKEEPYLISWFGETGKNHNRAFRPYLHHRNDSSHAFDWYRHGQGLIKHVYKRSDDVSFGLAIVIQELVRHFSGAIPIPQLAPDVLAGSVNVGAIFGLGDNIV